MPRYGRWFRAGRRARAPAAIAGGLVLVASFACLYLAKESPGTPTIADGTAVPVTGPLARVAGLFPKNGAPLPLSSDGLRPKGADAVWSELLEATSTSSRERCTNPPCRNGKNILLPWADLGDEMSHVQGAVVVRRPGLTQHAGMLGPANNLDFAETLRSYLPIFASSLIQCLPQAKEAPHLKRFELFLDAVEKGNGTAARYLSPHYYAALPGMEVEKLGRDGYEGAPTLVAQTDVFIHTSGYVWNDKDFVVPQSCDSQRRGEDADAALPLRTASYEKVFVLTQAWADSYYHFMAESLPRITLFLDVLLRHADIKIAVHAPRNKWDSRASYMNQFLDLLGMPRRRVVFIEEEIHAELAVLPDSTVCGVPNAAMVNMLRSVLLQAMYPDTRGVPPPAPRPVILLVVRTEKRGLKNNDQVREALEQKFPDFDVVEFTGDGAIEEQLKSFSRASVVVGPHGAGLANIMVSALHTPVLEIGPADCPPCFLQLALKLHHVYARHLAGTPLDAPCTSWFEPDVAEIVQLVRDLLTAKVEADEADPPRARYAHGAGR